ncbi:MAG TPA: ABC transporter permease [Actinobacteria bacterium]|nr:ABC transporter permease [Actinomycetota bacterium]
MSISRIFSIIKREISLGPRSPILLFALAVPLILTAVFQLIFGGLWQEKPVLAVYGVGDGIVVSELEKNKAVDIINADSEDEILNLVEVKEADVGVIFPQDIEDILKEGKEVVLKTYIDGEAYAKDRAVIAASIVSALRSIAPEGPEVDFEQTLLGEERGLNILEMMLPFLVLYGVLAGAFLGPAVLLVGAKEKKTITALLVTPSSKAEILTAFGLLGGVLAVIMGIVILLLNGGWTQPLLMILLLILSSMFMVDLGLIAGLAVNDMNALFANMKLFGIFLIAPQLFIFFPKWPQWIAKIFPTYYIMHPILRISIYGEGFAEIGWELLVLLGFIILFFIPIPLLAKRLGK